MKNYTKPIVIESDELVEGVYADSGKMGQCFTVTTNIHQTPEIGRGDYRIQVDADHAASDNHHSGIQKLTLSFNLPVDYVSSNGTLEGGGSGTRSVTIGYDYHQNGSDHVGLGDVVVTADQGLVVEGARLTCNYDCGQH